VFEAITENLDRYQLIIFKWLLFIIFVVVALEILDKHLHFKTHVKSFLGWLTQLRKL
jgi:hypothetical protein